MKRLAFLLLAGLLAAIWISGCSGDESSDEQSASKCFNLTKDIMEERLKCFGDDCNQMDNPSDQQEKICDCARDGKFYYTLTHDDEVTVECFSWPDNNYEWCMFGYLIGTYELAGSMVSRDDFYWAEDMCECLVQDNGYWGRPTEEDDPDPLDRWECFNDKENYCYAISASNAQYARCMCETEKWSKNAGYQAKYWDNDEQDCRESNSCDIYYSGLKKYLDNGRCEEIGGDGWNDFVFKEDGLPFELSGEGQDNEPGVDGDIDEPVTGCDPPCAEDEICLDGYCQPLGVEDGDEEIGEQDDITPPLCSGTCTEGEDVSFCMGYGEVCVCEVGEWKTYTCETICSMESLYPAGCDMQMHNGIAMEWCVCVDEPVDPPDGDVDLPDGDVDQTGCTNGETQCDGADVLMCEDGSWIFYDCDSLCGGYSNGCGEQDMGGQMMDWCICEGMTDGDVDTDPSDPCDGITCGANAYCDYGYCYCDPGCTGDAYSGCTCGSTSDGLCPSGQTCEIIFEGGGMACVIVQDGQLYIPEGAQQNCHTSGTCSQPNRMCVYLDEAGTQSACIELCGECDSGLVCMDITGDGARGCLTSNGEVPPSAPTGCSQSNVCEGNMSCYNIESDSVCIGNCSLAGY